MNIEDLVRVLPDAWEKRPDNAPAELLNLDDPSVGQCAVTALVVQDYFGGEIINTVAIDPTIAGVTSSHYLNVIDGEPVDLTKAQFREQVQFTVAVPKSEVFKSIREYILSYESTVKRYERLKFRVEELLVK